MSFGYSVGDAFTAIAVVTQIVKTLCDSCESRTDYQHLVDDLDNLKLVFKELERFSNAADSAAEHSHKNAIRGLASKYGDNLQCLLNRVQKFSQSLGPHRVVGALKSQRQKLQWAFFVKNEVPAWRGQVTVMIATIQILLDLNSSSAIMRQTTTLDSVREDLKAIPGILEAGQTRSSREVLDCRNAIDAFQTQFGKTATDTRMNIDGVMDVLQGFSNRIEDTIKICRNTSQNMDIWQIRNDTTLRSSLSVQTSWIAEKAANELVERISTEYGFVNAQVLTFINDAFKKNLRLYHDLRQIEDEKENQMIRPAPSWLLDDNFHIVDALGRPYSLPYQWFKHWPVFEAWLRCEFQNCPGQQKVIDQQYHILPQRQLTRSIGPNDWQSHVFPKSRFVMSMIIRHVNRRSKTCPRPCCDNVQIEASGPEPDMITCPKCDLNYRPSITDADPSPTLKTDTDSRTMVPRADRTQQSETIAKSKSDAYEEELRELGVFNMVDICEALTLGATVNPLKETSTSRPASLSKHSFYYICSVCEYTTKFQLDMIRHVNKHFPLQSEALFDCPSHDCSRRGQYGFKRKNHLTEHLRIVHKEDISTRRRTISDP